MLHRLVAEAYIPNPNNKTDVNHIDEDKAHNYINNLEWTTHKENCNHGYNTKKGCKKVYCQELDKTFDSAMAASRELGIDNSSISKCCRGKAKTYKGYHWRYVNE